jgi:hypothetical protein
LYAAPANPKNVNALKFVAAKDRKRTSGPMLLDATK